MGKGIFIDTGKSKFIKRRLPRKLKKARKKDGLWTLMQFSIPIIRQMTEYKNRASLMTLLTPAIEMGKKLYIGGIDEYDKDSNSKSMGV